MQEFDNPTPANPAELVWINNFLSTQTHISKEDIDSILYFSLIWNMFEGFVCNKDVSIQRMEAAVYRLQQRGNLHITDYSDCLNYFTQRYVENGVVNYRFQHLKFRAGDRENHVRDVLEGQQVNEPNILLALLIIIYRYRNNLFHGEKSLHDLPGQKDNFRTANQLLMIFMERWRMQ
jgi:hypothetical protein